MVSFKDEKSRALLLRAKVIEWDNPSKNLVILKAMSLDLWNIDEWSSCYIIKSVNEWISELMVEWVKKNIYRWVNENMNRIMNEWKIQWMIDWKIEWMNKINNRIIRDLIGHVGLLEGLWKIWEKMFLV